MEVKDKEQEKKKRKRNRRRKKSISNVRGGAGAKSENAEKDKMEAVEATGSKTPESVPSESPRVDPPAEDDPPRGEPRGDVRTAQAQTQTRKSRGTSRNTQTPVVVQSSKDTQTDFAMLEQDDANNGKTRPGANVAAETQLQQDGRAPEPVLRDDSAGHMPVSQHGNPASDSAKKQNPENESNSAEEVPSAGVSEKVPSAGVSEEVPSAGVSEEVPSAGVSEEVPSAAVSEEVPSAAVSEEVPSAGVSEEVPSAGVSEEVPSAGVSEEVPSAGVSEEVPSAGVSEEVPSAGVSEEVPSAGVSEKVPSAGVSEEVPSAGVSEEVPSAGVSEEVPSAGVSEEVPSAGVSEEVPSAGVSGDPKGSGLTSYAGAVSGEGKSEKPSNASVDKTADKTTKMPQSTRDRNPVTAPPPAGPMFTFHVYAVLEKKFRFNKEHDELVLFHSGGYEPLTVTHFVGVGQEGYLIEARFSVEESNLVRGNWLRYGYGVKQRQKELIEVATRHVQFPPNSNIKELHLYEGLISRHEERGFWKTGLNIVGWKRSKGAETSDAWQASARTLLDRIFQKWTPSDKQSTESLGDHLMHFASSLGSAHSRLTFEDETKLTEIMTSELISEGLVRILKGDPTEKLPGGANPLLLGLSVFTVTRKCGINLGVKGWAELCVLVSSEAAMEKKNLDASLSSFQSLQHTVLGLINLCAHHMVPELVLLVPLLLRLRQSGAGATKVGPTVEEENWSGLEGVQFIRFREIVQSCPDKRRKMMTLTKSQLSLAKETPLLLIGWLSVFALEDLPEFSDLTGIPAEHLIQSLLYRLRTCADTRDNNRVREIVKHAQTTLNHILKKVDEEKDRMVECGNIGPAFLSSVGVAKSTCRLVRLVPWYQAVVLSHQLVLKLADVSDAALTKQSEDDTFETSKPQQLLDKLLVMQQQISEWRDDLLQKPLVTASKALAYPKEIEMWNALLNVECSIEGVSSQWTQSLTKDLRKRISRASEEDQVLLCCLETTTAAVRRSSVAVQACFHELCQSAIKSICQRGQAGDLMRSLSSRVKDLPVVVLSAVVVQSAARFRDDPVVQLLDSQSAASHLLLQGDWKSIQVDDSAGQVVHSCVVVVKSLVESLLLGHVALGHLQTCLKHKEQFKKLYLQYKKNTAYITVPVGAEVVLAQREKDLNSFLQRKKQMDTLIKMMAKVKESITVPEMRTLEEQHSADLQTVALNQLVLVQSFDAEGKLTKAGPAQILWYNTSLNVLKMASEMHKLHQSNLILSSWVKGAASLASARRPSPAPVAVTLTQVCEHIWNPLLTEFCQLGVSVVNANVSIEQLDRVLVESGDRGDWMLMKKELSLMSEMISESGQFPPAEKWVVARLGQIQEYSQLHEAAAAASAMLKIADKMKLAGNFTEIEALRQLEQDSFKQRVLGSLSDDLFCAKHHLSAVTKQHTLCLEEFLASQTLVSWVKANLKNMSDVKVYVELASISAGENDTEIDQVACFHDAVMGYAPLLYSLSPQAGFREFMKRARHVWDTQSRDEKLPDKLRESTRLLSWLKALKETHGSVEQSSLSLASSINADGVYHVGWSDENTERRCLQNMVQVTVAKDGEEKSYKLEELQELQNKLMLMSSKGEHGREQVNRFTEVFEGVQRLGATLLQMQTSGNMLFREWRAEVKCCPLQQPCITVTFLSLKGKQMLYHGELTEQLQKMAHSMDRCQKEWRSFVGEMRSKFILLNHYTSEQMVYLCFWIHKVCQWNVTVPQQLWNLLFSIKPQCTLTDVRVAYDSAAGMMSKHDELEDDESDDEDQCHKASSELKPPSPGHTEEEIEEIHDLMEFSSEDEDECEMKSDDDHTEDSLENLWRLFKKDMSQYLNDYIDISTLAHFLSCLSDMNQQHMIRNLPLILQEGKPNLLLCPSAEVFTTVLSLYMESPEQPLPSADEVLVCREETTEEEVEIFLRRALSHGTEQNCQKIYCLVNPGLLGYDVSVALGELFEALERSANPQYRLVIVSPVVHQHKYVPSFFSNDKVQAGVSLTSENARKYLHHHFRQNTLTPNPVALVSPDHLSVWMVSSVRPAVGKSLYVNRLFEKFQQKSSRAKHIRIRLIEPCVDIDSLIKSLSETLATLREQDPVLLHIDTAGVRSGLEELLFRLLVLGCLSDSHGMLWRRNVTHLITVEVLNTYSSPQNQPKEITTFSSLLTRSDVKVVAHALGLHTDMILLLSLHQFDTEVSFCNTIRGFIQDAGHSPNILVIQMDLEESHCSGELMASAKYCTMNSLMPLLDQTCWVIFIVKVSRIPSQSQYIGFQGGFWQSVHIDDLRDSEDMSLNLLVFCGTLISNLLNPTPTEQKGDGERDRNDSQADVAHLHSLSLVRSCIQKAVGLLRDPSGVTSRSMQRMNILLTLLGTGQCHIGAHFQRVLLSRLAEALAQREERMSSPKEWVSIEAKKRQALQEGGTLRHTLWRRLQSAVIPILASMLEAMDRFANLDLLSDQTLSRGLTTLWLDILADSQVLDLTPLQKPSGSDQEVLVQHHFLLDGEEQPCSAPFSSLITTHLESLWAESEFMPVTTDDGTERILQFVSAFDSSRLCGHLNKLSDGERREFGHLYLRDFLLISLKIKSKVELRVLTRSVLGCMSELQSSACVAPDLSPAWIMAAAKHFAPRLDTLCHIFLLQPHLATDVFQQGAKRELQEMVDDISALGVCVEQTKLLTLTSLPACESFVSRVELLQPCLDRALGQKYSRLCSSDCVQHLDSIRSLWHGMLVVASFIQHVVFKVQHNDSRMKELALKHCNLHLNLMQASPDVRSVDTLRQLIRILNSFHNECIGRELRFGVSCAVCLSELREPAALPCQHVFCLPCVRLCLQPHKRSCPTCRADAPPDFAPTVSHTIKAALQQQAAVRTCCNSFFLEVVSRFCLSEGQRPGDGVVELLFSLLVSANGDVYRTRELTPFLECVDNSPVVRSVLPKLLLQYSFQQAKTHVETYLKNLEEKLLDTEDHTELYLLFVNCFQDSLLCSDARAADRSREQQTRAEITFLSRFARKQAPDRRGRPAEFLLSMAQLRICLSTAARLLENAAVQGSGEEVEAQYLRQVQAVCQYCGNDWHKVYLLRALHRLSGVERILSLMNCPDWRWLFPAELVRLQTMIPTSVDQFLCCGTSYRATRDAVARVLLENRDDAFLKELKTLRGSRISLVALALFRHFTCRYRSADVNVRPSPQERARLVKLLKNVKSSGEFRDFCASLLSNQIGGPGSRVRVDEGLSPPRRTVLELLVHLSSVLLAGNALLAPLQQVASQPHNVTNSFLPTMPDDHSTEARQWLHRGSLWSTPVPMDTFALWESVVNRWFPGSVPTVEFQSAVIVTSQSEGLFQRQTGEIGLGRDTCWGKRLAGPTPPRDR
uniref:Ring finger protein 213b n=1 Tax=Scophthalmus maximus TaxID=52904 RepID=A0A8D3DYF2_SCOMX